MGAPHTGRLRFASSSLLLGFFILFLPPSAAAASNSTSSTIDNAALISALGGTASGQVLTCGQAYTVTVVANKTTALISISKDTAMSGFGWVGFGLGTAMADADIVVLWPNSDGSWTLSHRDTTGSNMPVLVSDGTGKSNGVDGSGALAAVDSLSTSSSSANPTVVTFSRLLTVPSGYVSTSKNVDLTLAANQAFIYAYGDTNPGSSAQDSSFTQHELDMMGAGYADLSASFSSSTAAIDVPIGPTTSSTGTGTDSSAPGTNSTDTGSTSTDTGSSANPNAGSNSSGSSPTSLPEGGATSSSIDAGSTSPSNTPTSTTSSAPSSSSTTSTLSYSTLIQLHAICGAVAWLLTAPAGVLAARLFRKYKWMPWHWGIQVYLTTPLTIAAVGIAFYAVRLNGETGFELDTHKTVGFLVLLALVCQELLGLWMHLSGMKRSKHSQKTEGRWIRNYVHMGIGVFLIGAGFAQVYLGMNEFDITNTILRTAFWVPVGLFGTAYIISAVVAQFQSPPKKPSKKRKKHHHHHHHHHKKPKKKYHKKKKKKKKYKGNSSDADDEKKELLSDSSSSSGSSSSSDSNSDSESSTGSVSSSSAGSPKRHSKIIIRKPGGHKSAKKSATHDSSVSSSPSAKRRNFKSKRQEAGAHQAAKQTRSDSGSSTESSASPRPSTIISKTEGTTSGGNNPSDSGSTAGSTAGSASDDSVKSSAKAQESGSRNGTRSGTKNNKKIKEDTPSESESGEESDKETGESGKVKRSRGKRRST